MNRRPRSRFPSAALIAAFALAAPAFAQTGAEDRPTIEEITVIGRYPGPPLWKVTSGARTLWVFGELSPLPTGLEWDPRNAERVLERAGFVIGSPHVSATTLNPIRIFKLYRGARRLVRLPDDVTLADQMPPELYARYAALRMRYMPEVDDEDEELRPALAVLELYRAALDDTGLTSDSGVGKTIERKMNRSNAAKAQVVVEREPEIVLDEYKKVTLEAELICVEAMITTIETDLQGMKERANAWAVGDVEALKRFDYPDSEGNCVDTLETVEGFAELNEELSGKWLSAAERALSTYDTSFSVLPMRDLVADDGLLAQLAARGYTVTAP